jgi:hypothetical protein
MSTVKAVNFQVGQSLTASQNFSWYQPSSPDGTVRLGVGNAGATTSDVVTVSSAGLSSLALIPSGSSVPTNGMYLPAANTLGWSTNSSEKLRLDSSGNLGLGVTPSAWSGFGAPVIEMGAAGSVVVGSTSGTNLYHNAYYNGGYKYARSAGAAYYNIGAGSHYWFTAPSGTAGNAISFTQALTLTAAANLLLGGTADPGGSNALYIANRGSVPGTPSGGGVIYVEAGALKYKGSSGTVTTLANA